MSPPGKERKDFLSVIPDDLKLFGASDIKRAFDYLEKTFRLNRHWYTDFKKEFLLVERGMSEQEFFFRFTHKHIDPALQRILRRNDSVVVALARYLIRNKIENKTEERATKNHHPSNYWKKERRAK